MGWGEVWSSHALLERGEMEKQVLSGLPKGAICFWEPCINICSFSEVLAAQTCSYLDMGRFYPLEGVSDPPWSAVDETEWKSPGPSSPQCHPLPAGGSGELLVPPYFPL